MNSEVSGADRGAEIENHRRYGLYARWQYESQAMIRRITED